jgi:hypothetical protein
MDIPDLVQQALGDEAVQAGVSIGDEDAVCFTPTRTLLYRGEGLLSDESIDEYPHVVERLSMSEGRRKTKFVLSYVDGDRSFTVPGKRASRVLEPLLEGVFRTADVIRSTESINGVFRFSELTLVITERRLIKHIGEPVWDEDYEVFDYDDVTGLSFERASVATQIVLTVDGRPQRIKAPNEQAPLVRQTLEGALFAHYDVDSLEALNQVATRERAEPATDDAPTDEGTASATDDLGFDSGIDPLVTDSGDDDQRSTAGAEPSNERTMTRDHAEQETSDRQQRDPPATSDASGTGGQPTTEQDRREPAPDESTEPSAAGRKATDADTQARSNRPERGAGTADREPESADEAAGSEDTPREPDSDAGSGDAAASSGSGDGQARSGADPKGTDPATQENVEAIMEQLGDLTDAVRRQNELLESQHQAIRTLAARLEDEE